MRFEQERLPDGARKAFFLGDGAGVGKVRAPPGGHSLAMQTTSHLIPHSLTGVLTLYFACSSQGRQIAALIKEFTLKVSCIINTIHPHDNVTCGL